MSLTKSFIKSRNSYKVTFKVPKQVNPDNHDIRILGEFNGWNWDKAPSLKSTKDVFKVDVELEAGKKYEYRYMVNQSYWVNDGIADAYIPSPYAYVDNCVVVLDAPKVTAKKATTTKKTVAATKKAVAKNSKADFTKIEGIGPKIAQLIVNAGYTTYEGLAKAKKSALQTILSDAGKRYQMHDPSTWAKQSKLLAAGKLQQLKKLQDELKGGRKA